MTDQPIIERVSLCLVGVQVVVDVRRPFGDLLRQGWSRMARHVRVVPNLAKPPTAISYMQFIDADTRVWFLGVQVHSLAGFEPDHAAGLVGWKPGDATMAVWPEANGQEGGVAQCAYKELQAMGLRYDERFLGEFERCPLAWVLERAPADGEHQFMLPVCS